MTQPPRSAEALVARLCESSPGAVLEVKAALQHMGDEGIRALEQAVTSKDAKLRARARQCLGELGRDRGLTRLRAALESGGATLTEGLFAIDEVLGVCQRESVEELIVEWVDDLIHELPKAPSSIEAADALRRVLGEDAGLLGPETDFHHSDHVSLTLTATSGRGLPLTLGALYVEVARRAGVHAGLLPFPGHVLLGIGPPDSMVIVDPFVGGMTISEEACVMRLMALGAPPSPAWLQPASDHSMLLRHTRNLAAALDRHGRQPLARQVRAMAGDSH